jgi:hypothetical protein
MAKGNAPTIESAMFSKVPFAGLGCASCEKDITNINGRKVEYMPWQVLPNGDLNRSSRLQGKGFSKVLQNMRQTESMSRLEGTGNTRNSTIDDPQYTGSVSKLPTLQQRKTMEAYTDNNDMSESKNKSTRKPRKQTITINNSEVRPGSARQN